MAIARAKMAVLSPDKALRRELSTLSKHMTACMVHQISHCLRRSNALTDYDVQMICAKSADTLKAVCLLQTLLHRGRRACQLFFQCLSFNNPSLFHTVTRGAVHVTDGDHHHVQSSPGVHCFFNKETSGTVPSCVINIHNASLTNCIIGNNNDLCCQHSQTNDREKQQRLGNNLHTPSPETSEAHSIKMSNVENVIIGDNNYMSVESNLDPEDLEEMDSVQEDVEDLEE